MENTFQFEDFFDPKKIADIIAKDKAELAKKIREKVKERTLALEPATCLSFELYSGDSYHRSVNMEASLEYAKVLVAFMRERDFEGYRVESKVTPVALKAAEDAIIEFYSDEKIQTAVANEITRQLQENKIIKAALKADIDKDKEWLRHEFSTILAGEAGYSIAGQSIDTLATSMSHFFSSSVGKSILMSMGKVMGTHMGHMLVRYIAAAVSKALASAAFKAAILATIKKVGITILIKTIVGKALLALLALVGISGVPIAWIILPLIAAVLYYEYHHFPERLSQKLPDTIADSINNNFESLNLNVSKNIVSAVAREFIDEITKLRK